MAFTTDTFTDTSGTLLSAHTGESGAWTVFTGSMQIASNRLRPTNTTASLAYATGTPATAEYDVTADVYYQGWVASATAGICGRMTTPTATTYYMARHTTSSTAGNGQWELFKFVAGTGTSLGSFSQVLVAGTTYALKLEIRDAAKKLYVDGVERISSADNTITGAGRVGVRFTGGGSDTLGQHLDNFAASDIGAAAYTLSGTITPATPTTTGTIVTTRPTYALSGTVTPSTATTSGIMANTAPSYTLSGSVAPTAPTTTGSVTTTRPSYTLSGSVATTASTSGTLTNTAPTYTLSGTSIPAQPTTTGALFTGVPSSTISGSIAPTVSTSGTLTSTTPTYAISGSVTPDAPTIDGALSFATPTRTISGTIATLATVAGAMAVVNPTLLLTPTPRARTYTVPAESRRYAVPPESRRYTVPVEARTYEVN